MDKKDRTLLYLLDINSKLKESDLAKKLVTSKQVVNYRIKKLEREGVIKKFQAVPNLETLGINVYANIYFKLVGLTKPKEKEVISYLVNHRRVGYVALLGGRFDLSIVLVAKSIKELEKILEEIVSMYPKELWQYIISLRIVGLKFYKKYLSKEKFIQTREILGEERKTTKIDELDKKIIKLLSSNSRISVVDLSKSLKIPFSTIRMRIKNLESREVITGYSILFDLDKIGINNYKLFIKTRDKSLKFYNKLMNFAKNHLNITWFFKTLGDHDYELRIEVEDQKKFQEIIKEIRSEFAESLEDMETVIIFRELKEDYSVIIECLQ